MIVIRTAEEMARALDLPLQPEMKQLLRTHSEQLSEYEGHSIEELALFIVVQPHDTLAEIEAACPRRLVQVEGGEAIFAILPEIVRQHTGWIEVTFILSDDGYGLVLLVELGPNSDPLLLAACKAALSNLDSNAAE